MYAKIQDFENLFKSVFETVFFMCFLLLLVLSIWFLAILLSYECRKKSKIGSCQKIYCKVIAKSMKYYLRLILPPMMEILYHVNKNIHFSLKKKHQDAIGEMSEQADQLHKHKARSDSYFMSKTNLVYRQ